MDVKADRANDSGSEPDTGRAEDADFSFLPKNLISQCQVLIESFHDLHGYSCLPDILWKARLGPFIETHEELRQQLRKALVWNIARESPGVGRPGPWQHAVSTDDLRRHLV